MIGPSFFRHAGWCSPEVLTKTVTIIGCGAMGSNIALAAAKMGFHKFELWDADFVENHNLPNQAYLPKHVGLPKVEALSEVLTSFNDAIEVLTYNRFFTEEDKNQLKDYVILSLDSMQGRELVSRLIKNNLDVEMLFETRLGFDFGEINIIDPLSLSSWNNFRNGLVDDKDVEEGPCNQRICTTLVLMISGYLVHLLCSHAVATHKQEEWKFKNKTFFNLTPNIITMEF